MRLPRDLSGEEVARLLARHYGYRVKRNRGSHMTMVRATPGATPHSTTVPRHRAVSIARAMAVSFSVDCSPRIDLLSSFSSASLNSSRKRELIIFGYLSKADPIDA